MRALVNTHKHAYNTHALSGHSATGPALNIEADQTQTQTGSNGVGADVEAAPVVMPLGAFVRTLHEQQVQAPQDDAAELVCGCAGVWGCGCTVVWWCVVSAKS